MHGLARRPRVYVQRGLGDAEASDAGVGPRLLFKSEEGLVTRFMHGMRDLTERDMHAPGASPLLCAIAPQLAVLHSLPLRPRPRSEADRAALGVEGGSEEVGAEGVKFWHFLRRMLNHIATAPQRLPRGVTLELLEHETRRMRRCADAVRLPIIHGHGDLKPSNVMSSAGDTHVQFIDFELAGAHYRGYDLHKLFRHKDAHATQEEAAIIEDASGAAA